MSDDVSITSVVYLVLLFLVVRALKSFFLAYPMLCVFLVFDGENLDAFPQYKMKSTRK